jgi:transposase-like protein
MEVEPMKRDEARVGGRGFVRYSEAFKLHVVSEIDSGHLTIYGARRRYGIRGGETVQKWLRSYGKDHLLGKVVRVERPEEKDRIKELEAKVRELESTLAQSQVKLFAYESLIEVAEEHYDADFKKNFGAKQSSGALNNAKKQGSK